jgi:integrase
MMERSKLERVEKHPGVYRRHVKNCSRQGRCQCGYVLVYNGKAQTFRTLAEADEGKRLAQRQAKLTKAHANGHHRGVPEAECPECERGRAALESAGGTFGAFATAWYAEHEHEWEQRTRTDYSWRLNSHLLPWFGSRRPSEIDVDFVDRYKAHKLAESARLRKAWEAWRAGRGEKPKARPLSPRTINMTLILLSAILDAAEERKLIERNPAAGKRRRVKERKPKRTQLDTATAIEALLFAAGKLDIEAQGHPQMKVRLLPRRAIVATLLLSGARIGELVDDRCADVDLANGRIQYDSKTPAGCRWVRLLPALHDELATLRARRDPPPMTTCSGRRAAVSSQSRISVTGS